MQKCPFHEGSSAVEQDGEISAIDCPHCGNYRISNEALKQVSTLSAPPQDWDKVVSRGHLISTRETRTLLFN